MNYNTKMKNGVGDQKVSIFSLRSWLQKSQFKLNMLCSSMNGKKLEKLTSLLKVYFKIIYFVSYLFLNVVTSSKCNTDYILVLKISPLLFCILGDNNFGDDRLLYAHGQLWLQQHHIMGRAVGLVHILDISCILLTKYNCKLLNIWLAFEK